MVRNVRIIAALGIGAMVLSAFAAGAPAAAITAELAKKCRALAIKAHPYKLPGQKGPGSAEAERAYFNECVAKGGNMSDEAPAGESQSGQGAAPAEAPK